MVDVTVVCRGLGDYKARAVSFPLLRYREAIRARGIDIELTDRPPAGTADCDVLVVVDKAFTADSSDDLSTGLERLRTGVDQLLWFDTTDSTGTLNASVLPYVDGYLKKQLLVDRSRYLEPMHGLRPYTDYYHETFGVTDDSGPELLDPAAGRVTDEAHLEKLRLSWNLGIVPHFPYAAAWWRFLDTAPDGICSRLPWNHVLGTSVMWPTVDRDRPIDVSGRFSTNYDRETISYHRSLMARALAGRADFSKVGTIAYWRELRRSKLLLSPFGWGEVCHRDFEGLASGCLLIKPEMSHMETWPPVYEEDETMVSVAWDMGDLEEVVDHVLADYADSSAVAANGQRRYREYLVGETARRRFVDHFEAIVTGK